MKNVIILTGGLAGSSVLTSLLHRAGYWTGNTTMQKHDYNTWENTELIALNEKLLSAANFHENWTMVYRDDFIPLVSAGTQNLDTQPYRAFVEKCAQHAPWVWKDPRLWLTIRFWKPFLDLSKVGFLVIQREHRQSWISTTLRRQIQTPDYARRYSEGVHRSILQFLDTERLPYIDILYEDLLLTPHSVIARINDLVGTALHIDDLTTVFRGTLYQRQHGGWHWAKAMAIYLKNYSQRYR